MECCFISNAADIQKFNANIDELAKKTLSCFGIAAIEAQKNATAPTTTAAKKSVAEVAKEVLQGKWGNGTERKSKLEAAGYNYSEVQAAVNAASGKTTTTTTTTTAATAPKVKYYARYFGTTSSIVTALNSLAIGSSFANRTKIAAANGIKPYSGTAAQNIELLNLLKQGKLIKP